MTQSLLLPRGLCDRWVVVFIALLSHVCTDATFAEERRITPGDDLEDAFDGAQPGDVFILADGEWRDAELVIRGEGTSEQPIFVRAQTPGEVVLTGESRLRMSGRHIVVSGLYFRDIAGSSDVIQFRTSSQEFAHHCLLTDCAIVDGPDGEPGEEHKWVSLHGTLNQVDHCYFAGKRSGDPTLVVWVTDEPNFHRIRFNHFGPRPPLGRNGGETIRVGTSNVSFNSSKTLVDDNLFFRCDGEAEIISSKSCDNVYHGNTFQECSGALTLRHGDRCRVEGNFFLGDGTRGAGGVRIIGRDHTVVNNYFADLRGDDGRSTISFMNGIVDSPLNGYWQVERALVAFNTIINCDVPMTVGVGADDDQPLPPMGCSVVNNVILGEAETLVTLDDPIDWRWEGNIVAESADAAGFERADDGLWRPTSASPTVDASIGEWPTVYIDIDGQTRTRPFDAGCDEVAPGDVRHPLTAEAVGPTWLSPAEREALFSQ